MSETTMLAPAAMDGVDDLPAVDVEAWEIGDWELDARIRLGKATRNEIADFIKRLMPGSNHVKWSRWGDAYIKILKVCSESFNPKVTV